MQVVNLFVNNRYDFVVLTKPPHADYLVITPRAPGDGRPVLILWDLDETKIDAFAVR